MQRGSDRHGPRADEDLKKQFEATEHANRPTRAHEWRDPEPEEPEDEELGGAPGEGESGEGAPDEGAPGEGAGVAGAEADRRDESTGGGPTSG